MTIDIQENVSLANYSTIKVGGNAEYFTIANSRDELVEALAWARDKDLGITILGWGSNTLISDNGIPGLTIINRSRNIEIGKTGEKLELNSDLEVRLNQNLENSQQYYSFADLDYDESDKPRAEIIMDSGVPWQMAINYTITQGYTGLQFFSGIPGTVGGAVVNNMHGGSHFVSEFVQKVEVVDKSGKIYWLEKDELEFVYDGSRFHHSQEVVLRVQLSLFLGDKQKALATSMEWAKRKKIQPSRSLGCMWQNITEEQKISLGLDGVGMGYINDQKLNLKGYRVGKAWISNAHAAFIETEDGATASDVYAILKHVENRCQEVLGFTPKLEIFLLGEF